MCIKHNKLTTPWLNLNTKKTRRKKKERGEKKEGDFTTQPQDEEEEERDKKDIRKKRDLDDIDRRHEMRVEKKERLLLAVDTDRHFLMLYVQLRNH